MPDAITATGILVLADGTAVRGRGFGTEGVAVGEVCFNTAMTGYQEVMTDPSYAAQIVTFTFPHIGNVGANHEDEESANPFALGCIVRQDVTDPSNYRSTQHFDHWMKTNGRIGLSGVDTRALTRRIREQGAPNAVIAYRKDGVFDVEELVALAREWPGLEGMDLARGVSALQSYQWRDGLWTRVHGYAADAVKLGAPKVVAVDYGIKRNIVRSLVDAGADVTVVPATASFDDIQAHAPRRSGGDRRICRAGDPEVARYGQADVRDMPGASDAGPGRWREDRKDVSGAPRGEPPGQATVRWPR
jgi:carbamoyl-phosphate synthase small subunit